MGQVGLPEALPRQKNPTLNEGLDEVLHRGLPWPAVHLETDCEPVVIVVDDNEEIRELLELRLNTAGLSVESYSSAECFLEQCALDRPGCMLLDVRMSGMSGLELNNRLAQTGWLMPVIIITGQADVEMAVSATKAGAFDVLEKPFNTQKLLECVSEAIEANHQERRIQEARAERRARLSLLTPREHQVMQKLVVGKSSKQIAADLGISMKTVEKHRAKVMRKTQADSVAELVRLVLDS